MENRKIRYTFLLPAYKPNFLEEALLSLRNQTYIDFNVIVSDDSSPYDLKSIFDKVCGDDARFTYRRNDVNMGGKSLVSHWNLLVEMCGTEFFIMASDDDVYEPLFLEKINSLTQEYPQVNLFRAGVRAIDANGKEVRCERNFQPFMSHSEYVHNTFNGNMISCEANYVYRTEVFKKMGGFVNFPKAWFSDDATHIVMSNKGCCATGKILFGFRNSSDSISGQWGNPSVCADKIAATLKFYKWFETYLNQPHSQVSKNDDVRFYVNKRVIRSVDDCIYFLRFSDFIEYLYLCPSNLGFNKPRMFIHWLRCKVL